MQKIIDTPLGTIRLTSEDAVLSRLELPGCSDTKQTLSATQRTHISTLADEQIIQQACQQLHEYFRGNRQTFNLPISTRGTEFQELAWAQLQNIPYATTRSYQWQCHNMGRPRAARAVGAANGRNPLPIIIPCHRVIGANGALTGYTGGLAIKQFLLSCESFFAQREYSSPSSKER
ncbi:MAG: methylated-DNA--[protein]-cysteine S-methyltransferase [Porticoccaceae bacterium]|nr:methylated-DNA--[protein]-cysteine S-methyltransferase [Porticoccaceae bacterium]